MVVGPVGSGKVFFENALYSLFTFILVPSSIFDILQVKSIPL